MHPVVTLPHISKTAWKIAFESTALQVKSGSTFSFFRLRNQLWFLQWYICDLFSALIQVSVFFPSRNQWLVFFYLLPNHCFVNRGPALSLQSGAGASPKIAWLGLPRRVQVRVHVEDDGTVPRKDWQCSPVLRKGMSVQFGRRNRSEFLRSIQILRVQTLFILKKIIFSCLVFLLPFPPPSFLKQILKERNMIHPLFRRFLLFSTLEILWSPCPLL